MFKHLTTQVGNVGSTVASIGTGTMKKANNMTGGIIGSQLPPLQAAAEKPQVQPIPKRDKERPVRVLSLDGGGVRGYSALIILRDYLLRVKTQLGLKEDILPADYFDLIIGTSTGGIMALMLGRLRMSIDQAIESYQLLSSKIFGGGAATTVLSGGLLGTGRGLGLGMGIVKGRDLDQYLNMAISSATAGEPAMYDASKLEKHVKRTIKAQPHTWEDEDALLEDSNEDHCYTAVIAARQNNATAPYLMRSYLRKDQPTADKVKVWEAARATSAAPAFFTPITIGALGIPYIDGAVSGHCNPSERAREEAEYLWPDRDIGLLLSLGTGSPTEVSLAGAASSKLIGFIGMCANTVQVHERVSRAFNQTHGRDHSPYVRLSVEHKIQDIRLDDFEKMPQIAASTTTYLATEAAIQRMDHAIELAERKEVIKMRPGSFNSRSSTLQAPLSPTQAPM